MQKQAYSTTCLTQYTRMHLLFFDNENGNDQVEFSGAVTKTFNQGLALWENYYPPKIEKNTSESDKYNSAIANLSPQDCLL